MGRRGRGQRHAAERDPTPEPLKMVLKLGKESREGSPSPSASTNRSDDSHHGKAKRGRKSKMDDVSIDSPKQPRTSE